MSSKRTKKQTRNKAKQEHGKGMLDKKRREITEGTLLALYLVFDLIEIWPSHHFVAIFSAVLFCIVIAFVEFPRRYGIAVSVVLVIVGIALYQLFPQILVSVSPEKISVDSTEWSSLRDVTLSNRTDDVLYDCDFHAQPSSKVIEYSVDLLSVGSGSIVLPIKSEFTDGSLAWPVSQIGPKSTIVFQVRSHLKKWPMPTLKRAEPDIYFSVSPASSKPKSRVATRP